MSTDLVIGHCKVINPYTIDINPQDFFKQMETTKKTAVATGCPLCSRIWSSAETYENSCKSPYQEEIVIVMKDDKPWLYIPIDDWYYSDTYIQINYCPKCGRRLTEE